MEGRCKGCEICPALAEEREREREERKKKLVSARSNFGAVDALFSFSFRSRSTRSGAFPFSAHAFARRPPPPTARPPPGLPPRQRASPLSSLPPSSPRACCTRGTELLSLSLCTQPRALCIVENGRGHDGDVDDLCCCCPFAVRGNVSIDDRGGDEDNDLAPQPALFQVSFAQCLPAHGDRDIGVSRFLGGRCTIAGRRGVEKEGFVFLCRRVSFLSIIVSYRLPPQPLTPAHALIPLPFSSRDTQAQVERLCLHPGPGERHRRRRGGVGVGLDDGDEFHGGQHSPRPPSRRLCVFAFSNHGMFFLFLSSFVSQFAAHANGEANSRLAIE